MWGGTGLAGDGLAAPSRRCSCRLLAYMAPATAIGDVAELGDIDVEQRPGVVVLVARSGSPAPRSMRQSRLILHRTGTACTVTAAKPSDPAIWTVREPVAPPKPHGRRGLGGPVSRAHLDAVDPLTDLCQRMLDTLARKLGWQRSAAAVPCCCAPAGRWSVARRGSPVGKVDRKGRLGHMPGHGVLLDLPPQGDLLACDHYHSGVRGASLHGDQFGRRTQDRTSRAAPLQPSRLPGLERVGFRVRSSSRVCGVEEQQRGALLDVHPDPATGQDLRRQHHPATQRHDPRAGHGALHLDAGAPCPATRACLEGNGGGPAGTAPCATMEARSLTVNRAAATWSNWPSPRRCPRPSG